MARATGIALRGFHSNSSNSTASSTADNGAAKVADIPAAAPATRSVRLSILVRWKQLRDHGAERPTSHDDRAFGAERSA